MSFADECLRAPSAGGNTGGNRGGVSEESFKAASLGAVLASRGSSEYARVLSASCCTRPDMALEWRLQS